ncbi:MAG: DNA-processing protein DprA [Candidatus Marinimicrobia bacterium]|nr:DNA-processing protein DprA [Candidatus Neomarinimicrobiota bacterium]
MANSISDIIRILSIQGVGPRRSLDLFQKFGSLKNIFSASSHQLVEVSGVTQKIAQAILAPLDEDLLVGQVKLLEKFKIEIITIWDQNYPRLLKQIYDPPIVLFCRGDLELLNKPSIGMVGTRTPTSYGKEITAEFSADLGNRGYTLVSGAAKGIDTVAHRACLHTKGRTIAVLGNGIDRVYPAENRELYAEITAHGLLISEFLMGSKPDAPNFPRRNRIISGLSAGTVVIEAAEQSGSLITAYYALDQNREVFAVPGNVKSRQSHGTHHLIRQGAKLVESVADIVEELGGRYRLGSSGGQQEPIISVDPKEAEILKHFPEYDSIHIDDLSNVSGQTTFALLGILLQMEMAGIVQQLPGKYFKRK